jgi:membrane glycosyltransferase
MPVCDEPVARVFAGLRATRESLARAGAVDAFDFFILSDSVDPDVCADEVAAWADWRRDTAGGRGIFYRRRRVRQKRKRHAPIERFGHACYMVSSTPTA